MGDRKSSILLDHFSRIFHYKQSIFVASPRLKKPADLPNRIKLRELHHGRRRYRPGARNGHRDRGCGHSGHLNVTVQPLPTRVLDFLKRL
jgi:hypothetical protein